MPENENIQVEEAALSVDKAAAKKIIESVLFVARDPMPLKQLKKVTGFEVKLLEQLLDELMTDYSDRGMQLLKIANGYQICTRPEYAEYVDKVINEPVESKLTHASMETLAIVAYKQPIGRLEVERIRGVDSVSAVQTLLSRELIVEVGRGEGLGRPILYGTSEEFLKHFGLGNITQLPPMPDLEGRAEVEAETQVLMEREQT
ncbi:MAG: SMC-Scp complex subunit ScpB [bacterium]